MVQGTASGVGKSLLVAALCRLLRRQGLEVRPFKAQNMALNAAVTADGGEVGRAQALQALACGVDVTRAMNPILLKPEGDRSAQLVVDGEVVGRMDAAAYHALKPRLWPVVTAALDRLRAECDVVVIEGAGSPAEVNLRDRDIVNMRVAAHAGAPVLLAGDIDRGGVFAALLGTLALLRPAERRRVAGLVVNNFRGDPLLFEDGAAFLERRSRLPVLGVIPHVEGLRLAQEDSLGLPAMNGSGGDAPAAIDVALVGLPRISNFDDCDPLLREPGVSVRLVDRGDRLGDPDLVVLPGSKASRADLEVSRDRGLHTALRAARRRGTAVLGICGGMQLLGRGVDDPGGVDAAPGCSAGFGLLPTATRMSAEKVVRRVAGEVRPLPGLLEGAAGLPVRGYEIHAGRTPPRRPPLRLWPEAGGGAWEDGATSPDGWVVGTHLHGLLDEPGLRRALLAAVARRRGRRWRPGPPTPGPEAELDRLADAVGAALDMTRLDAIIHGVIGGVAR
ncbi:MAG: cbiP [Chloroflexi bacterium]|nr:cbiP [Chloroflexota bacterium]